MESYVNHVLELCQYLKTKPCKSVFEKSKNYEIVCFKYFATSIIFINIPNIIIKVETLRITTTTTALNSLVSQSCQFAEPYLRLHSKYNMISLC